MVEAAVYSKPKIHLNDYDYKRDIQNRVLLSKLTPEEIEITEELTCSSSPISFKELESFLEKPKETIAATLRKIAPTSLCTTNGETIQIDKERRRLLEIDLQRFSSSFVPNFDFLHSLLKKVPLDTLMNWYPIPRTSNNIFESLIERYVKKPSSYARYLEELDLEDDTLNAIKRALISSPEGSLDGEDLQKKYRLSDEQLERAMILFEWHFVGSLHYEKEENQWKKVVSFFREWQQYLHYMESTKPSPFKDSSAIVLSRPHPFSFIEDLCTFLSLLLNEEVYLELNREEQWIPDLPTSHLLAKKWGSFPMDSKEDKERFFSYCSRIIYRLLTIQFIAIRERKASVTDQVSSWLPLSLQEKATYLYRSILKCDPLAKQASESYGERAIRSIEKSLSRIEGESWVLWDAFERGITPSLGQDNRFELCRTGRHWAYTPPSYAKEEKQFIKAVLYNWFFEAGMIQTGTYKQQALLRPTPFGIELFGTHPCY